MSSVSLPPYAACEQARLSRDARFDGLFFTAVRTTGIYCRPTCPAPPPKAGNVDYLASAAAAEAGGYRPCLRCRPELAPAASPWRRSDALLGLALQLIEQGVLEHERVPSLAQRLHIGERQLRRLFAAELGVSPLQVESTRRLLFAKQLLSETRLPITEIALAAGFTSVRRFNAAFLAAYGMAPNRLRLAPSKAAAPEPGTPLVLRLSYRPPYDFSALLAFLGGRALAGMERVQADSYARVIATEPAAWLRLRHCAKTPNTLQLELHGVSASALRASVQRVRRMFDLDADPNAIAGTLSRDPRLAPLIQANPGLRLPSGWDGFEIAVRAVIGQQISVAAARTVTQRLLQRCDCRVPDSLRAHGFECRFPSPAELQQSSLEGLGLTGARQRTLRALTVAVLEGRLDFEPGQAQQDFIQRCVALPGIGPWTAHYLALRALGQPDALPSADLVLQKTLYRDGNRASARELEARAEAWRPWRSYAVMHLWRAAAQGE